MRACFLQTEFCSSLPWARPVVTLIQKKAQGWREIDLESGETSRLDDEEEYEFSVLNMRFKFGGRKFSKMRVQNLKLALVVVANKTFLDGPPFFKETSLSSLAFDFSISS